MSIKTDILARVGEYIQVGEVFIFYAQFGLSFVGDTVTLWVNKDGLDRKRIFALSEFVEFGIDQILQMADDLKLTG